MKTMSSIFGFGLFSIALYFVHILLTIPIDKLSNFLYRLNPFVGEFFLIIDSLLILFLVYFLYGYLLYKSSKSIRWAMWFGAFSTIVTVMFLRVDIYEESYLLLARKCMLYIMPMLATVLGWYLHSGRKSST